MEDFSPKTICFQISSQTIMVLILYAGRLAAGPIWMWTQGCVTGDMSTINVTNNGPNTCFQACGQDTSRVALKGNLCSCDPNPKLTKFRPASYCNTSCEFREMTACGNPTADYWSVYKQAKQQELSDHGIPGNATGCVVYNEGLFHVENCSRPGLHSLCISQFTSYAVYFGRDAGKWSLYSCDNLYDRLIDKFPDHVQGYSETEKWIGLFALNEKPSIETTIYTPTESTRSPTKDYVSPSESSTLHLEMTDYLDATSLSFKSYSTEISQPYSTLSDYLESSLSPTPLFHMDLSSSLVSDLDQISSEFTHKIVSSSLYDVYIIHTELKQTDVFTKSSKAHTRKSLDISPTKSGHSDPSSDASSVLHYSLADSSTMLVPEVIISFTPALSHLPNHFESTKHSPIFVSASEVSRTLSSVLSMSKTSNISPKNQKSELITIQSSPTRTNMPSSRRSSDLTNSAVVPASSSQSVISSQIDNWYDSSTTTTFVSTTSNLVQNHEYTSPKTEFLVQKMDSKTDLVIVLIVVGAIAALSLVAVGCLTVYIKRSLTKLRKVVNRTTTLTDDPPNVQAEEISLENSDGNLRRSNTYSDLEDTSYCPRGTRSDHSNPGDGFSSLFHGRFAKENEYILY